MYQPPGPTENETSLTMQLLTLRGEISDLEISEGRLGIQEAQLQVLIGQHEGYLQGAQASGSSTLVSQTQDRLAALRARLASIQAQMAPIREQKGALEQQRETILTKLQIVRTGSPRAGAGPYAGAAWSPAASPWPPTEPTWPPAAPPWAPVKPRRRWGRLVFLFGLLIVLVVLLLIGRSLYPSLLAALGKNPASDADQAVFSSSGAAPSNMQCLSEFSQSCFSPEDIQQAFRLNPLYKQGYTGKGQTIVIISAGYTTTLQADLHTFDQAWGLPDPKLTILHPDGPTVPYQCGVHDGLQGETTLDVEWSHAIAPGANITLVIGSNDSGQSPQDNCAPYTLVNDVQYALDQHLGQVISISYGASELGSNSDTAGDKAAEQRYYQAGDAIFQRVTRAGITIVAASGDDGATNPDGDGSNDWKQPNVGWPASDPSVLAVGGTELIVDPENSVYGSEVAWNEPGKAASGGGLSAIYPEPNYQTGVPNQKLFQGKRGVPDVAFPAENFMIYGSFFPGQVQNDPQWTHWADVGGTSASAPSWAGLIAIADQMRGKPLGQIQPALYKLGGKDMHDITDGDNSFGGLQGYQAQPSYDLVTGWGTPIANTFIPALIQAANQTGG